MRLTKAQESIMNDCKDQIDYARTHDFVHWLSNARGYDLDKDWDAYPNPYLTNAGLLARAEEEASNDFDGFWHKAYEERKNGIALTHCNSRTLYALERLELIELIYDSKDGGTIDLVKVLNY